MKRLSRIAAGVAFATALTLGAGFAADNDSTITGEVVQMHSRVKTQNGAEFDELTIRTRQGEERRLRLGSPGGCEGCVREGDRVRARVVGKEPRQEALLVRKMKVRRSGSVYQFRNEAGDLVRTRTRSRLGEAGGGRSGVGAGGLGRNGSGVEVHQGGGSRSGRGGGRR